MSGTSSEGIYVCINAFFRGLWGKIRIFHICHSTSSTEGGGGRGRVDIKWNGPDSGLVMQVIQIETDLVLDKVFIITLHILFNLS